jgi:hypothetical protein
MLTGRYAMRAGLPNNLGPNSVRGLPLSEILMPQLSQLYESEIIPRLLPEHTT